MSFIVFIFVLTVFSFLLSSWSCSIHLLTAHLISFLRCQTIQDKVGKTGEGQMAICIHKVVLKVSHMCHICNKHHSCRLHQLMRAIIRSARYVFILLDKNIVFLSFFFSWHVLLLFIVYWFFKIVSSICRYEKRYNMHTCFLK